jgi:hypothetical protein
VCYVCGGYYLRNNVPKPEYYTDRLSRNFTNYHSMLRKISKEYRAEVTAEFAVDLENGFRLSKADRDLFVINNEQSCFVRARKQSYFL